MNIAKWAVNRPVAVTMRIAALVLLGLICLFRLPVDLLPKVTLPTVSVSTQWPNVAPEEIEAEVTRPIEQAVSSATNLYQVSSTTSEGSSSVRIQFQWGTDIGQAALEVIQLVQRAKRGFPNDPTLQDPLVFKFDPSQSPILIFGVSGEKDPVKLRTLLDNQISPMIESANGVASATVAGGQERAIIVDIDPVKLQAHKLSTSDVIRRIAQENLNLPAGIAKQSETEYTIRSLGWFTSPEEIGKTPIGMFNGQIVYLSQIAEVRDSHDEVRIYTRLNSQPSATIVVSKQSGANTVSTADAVFDKVAQVKKLYPHLNWAIASDQSQFISNSITDVKTNAMLGGVLAVLILLFFLRNVRSTLVVALSIPISIISTFALLYFFGFTLNTMSLGGLALATGLIVDDAVVVLENIFRHIERDKKSSREAAISGTNEILSAVVASTWTVMVVFLPLLLIKGQSGQMFTQFALVVIFSLAVSLLDATTVVPMLATRVIHGEAHREAMENGHERGLLNKAFNRFGRWFNVLDTNYRHGLKWALSNRWKVITGALLIIGASLLLKNQIGTEMMPQTDSGDFNISIKMPIGTALDKTNAVMRQVEAIIQTNPNVKTVLSTAGSSIGRGGGGSNQIPYQGGVTVKLKEDRKDPTQQVIADVRRQLSRIPGVRAQISQFDLVSQMMTGGNQNVEVDIFGDDLGQLSGLARDVMSRIRNISGLENLDVNWQEAMPEIQWKVDRDKAQQLGVSFQDVASTINTATNGSIASYFQEKGFEYPIIVQMPESARKTVEEMQNLKITPSSPGVSGRTVLLRQVAKPIYGTGPSQITRQDRQRFIAVTGTPQGRSAGEIQADIQKAISGLQMPAGYYWDWGTNQKRRAEEFGGLGLAVFLAIALIYMLLASQFESFVHPFTILLSVPLATAGVILALFLTGRSFGLTAFIGVLMLVGIVVKNGILLVDYTNVLRNRGVEREEALLTAGPTRLRPILMTASAAVLGMLPIAIGFGKGSEIQAPMATAVIGGLITSTALTLFVVPTVYSLLDDLGIRLRGKDKYDQREPVPAGDGHYDAVADGVEKDIHAGLE
jgi:HAE1 family hydrophobic/amphiphilic exporter-1